MGGKRKDSAVTTSGCVTEEGGGEQEQVKKKKKEKIVAEGLLPSTIRTKRRGRPSTPSLSTRKGLRNVREPRPVKPPSRERLSSGEEPPLKKIPHTIDNTRELDETICKPEDEELFAGNDADEFSSILKQGHTPKRGPAFISDLLSVIPKCTLFQERNP